MIGPRMHSRGGFTLLEVLIALAILLTAIIAILLVFPTSLFQARQAVERSITAQTADSVMGEIRASSAEALFFDRVRRELLTQQQANQIYTFTTTVQRLNGASNVYLQRITLNVVFNDERQETFVTYVSRQ